MLILAVPVFLLLASAGAVIKYNKPFWQFDTGQLWLLAILCLAFSLSFCIIKFGSMKGGLSVYLKIFTLTISILAVSMFCLLLAGPVSLGMETIPRSILLFATGAALVLGYLAVLPVDRKLEAGALICVLLALTGMNLLYHFGFLPKDKTRIITRHVASSLHNLEIRSYRHFVAKPVSAGGALSATSNQYVLATGDGTLYLFAHPEDNKPLEPVELDIRIPINYEEFRRDAGQVQTANFRVTDLLINGRDENYRIFAAHHYWNTDSQCFTIRVSLLDTSGLPLARLPAATPWKTVFETSPCLALKNFIRGQPFAGEESGGRLALTDGNTLLLTVGDHEREGWNSDMVLAQEDTATYGKILEIDIDSGGYTIKSKGHRNPQGLYVDPQGQIWSTEHGPAGGDELNLISRGRNYGWPYVSYGVDYIAGVWPLNSIQGSHEGYEQPVYSWTPALGISSLIGIEKPGFDLWKDDLIISSLRDESLWRARIHDQRIVASERIRIGSRIRDLIEGKNGELILWSEHIPELIFIRSAPNLLSGEIVFARCQRCHATEGGRDQMPGPALAGIFGKKIASDENFSYSAALAQKEGKWTHENLRLFLNNPHEFAPGTTMQFEGIKDEEDLETLVNYLKDL